MRSAFGLRTRSSIPAVTSHEAAIAALVHSEDPWLKSCGLYAIGKLGLKTFDAELERLTYDRDPLLQKRLAEARAMLNR